MQTALNLDFLAQTREVVPAIQLDGLGKVAEIQSLGGQAAQIAPIRRCRRSTKSTTSPRCWTFARPVLVSSVRVTMLRHLVQIAGQILILEARFLRKTSQDFIHGSLAVLEFLGRRVGGQARPQRAIKG